MATFSNVKLNTAGNYTLTASDGALNGATSTSFTVSPAAASKVVYGVQPGNVTAGVADSPSIVVDVEDPFGNIVTTDRSSVTLSVASGPGSASGTLTAAASSGIATFGNVKLNTAGNYTLTASDGALTGATSSSFTVSPAAASQMVYGQEPGNATAGSVESPSIVVDVEDQFGNIVTTDSSTVTLAVASGPGSASGTLTVAASGGVATFSNVKLNTAGSYTLTASDGSLTSATSSSFAVSAASASKVVYGVRRAMSRRESPTARPLRHRCGGSVRQPCHKRQFERDAGRGQRPGKRQWHIDRGGQRRYRHLRQRQVEHRRELYPHRQRRRTERRHLHQLHGLSGRCLEGGVWRSARRHRRVADSPSITVEVEDQFGNIVTTDSSNVTLAVASGPGSLSGTLTVAASSGIATFNNVKLNTAGSYTLTASDGSLTPATSSSFTVSPAAASKVVYGQQPEQRDGRSRRQPGRSRSRWETSRNIVTTDSSNVTLSVASGPGSLSGTVTLAASSGIATFSNVKLNTAGSYTLTASRRQPDAGHVEQLCRQCGGRFEVVYAVQPSNVTAGVADSPSIVVDVEDPFPATSSQADISSL